MHKEIETANTKQIEMNCTKKNEIKQVATGNAAVIISILC
jgi:hypothetical protein